MPGPPVASISPTSLCRFMHDPYRLVATVPSAGMRTENNRVARLDGHDAFEQDGRSGVRNWGEREDDADGFSHLHHTAFGKLANRANGRFIFDVVVNELGGHHRSEERRVGKECRSRWSP